MLNFFLRISTVLLLALIIAACDSQKPRVHYINKMVSLQNEVTVWDRLANNLEISTNHQHPRVQQFIKQFTKNNAHTLVKFSEQATPFIYHIVSTTDDLNLPNDLALLPIIESEYVPSATSNKGASGLWQLAALTGRLYGLKQDHWYDGRKDVDAATKAALGHLKYLYESFDNDWLLALAAYNCGEARVEQAIRYNKKHGKPTDYWSLSLPKETMYFVPKFLAVSFLIKNHQQLGIELAPIANKPYFIKVKLDAQMHLHTAAKLADLDVKEIQRLNSAYRSHVTHPNGPHHILLPVKNASIFRANFSTKKSIIPINPEPKQSRQQHTVVVGDTLADIAIKYRTSVQNIKHKNQLTSDTIVRGQVLSL